MTTSSSQTLVRRPGTTWSAVSSHSRFIARRWRSVSTTPPRRTGDNRAPRRLLRRPCRDGGHLLHEAGRPVRGRLLRAPVDPGRPPADRLGRSDAVEISADGRPSLAEVPAPDRSFSASRVFAVMAVLIPVAIAYVVTHAARAEVPPANLGASYEEVAFTTSDGLRLKGWYIPSRNGAAVISFPGRASSQKRAKLLANHGYGVLLFDRRGEGESEGDPNTFGWQGERDIHAAVAFLQRRPDVDPGADRRDRPFGRRRDDDGGGGGILRSQGDRLGGCKQPLRCATSSRMEAAGRN